MPIGFFKSAKAMELFSIWHRALPRVGYNLSETPEIGALLLYSLSSFLFLCFLDNDKIHLEKVPH